MPTLKLAVVNKILALTYQPKHYKISENRTLKCVQIIGYLINNISFFLGQQRWHCLTPIKAELNPTNNQNRLMSY